MGNLSWLAGEAQKIHAYFESIFYVLVTFFLILAVVLEYFKLPLGQTPSFATLISRAFIAIFLLHTYQEISNLIGDLADQMTQDIGGFTNIHLVLTKMGQKYHELTWNWISIKDSAMLLISFLGFFLLYFSVHVTEAFILYAWTLLYVVSPLLISLFVFPQTASATKGLYRSLVEISAWKVMWSILATLLWSAALSEINNPEFNVNFLTALCFNIILAGSLLLTPKIVQMLAGAGISGIAGSVGLAAIGAAVAGPLAVTQKGSNFTRAFVGGVRGGGLRAHGFMNQMKQNRTIQAERDRLSQNPYESPKSVEKTLRRKFKSNGSK